MNQPFLPHQFPRLTQAAEGLPRWRWTVAEIEAMTNAGIFTEDERFELIGGEIVPMNPKGIQHEVLKTMLNLHFAANTPVEFLFTQETTFRLNEDSFVEPDFIFYRKADGLANLNPRTALLAVEVADSSLAWDLGRKARLRHPRTVGDRSAIALDPCPPKARPRRLRGDREGSGRPSLKPRFHAGAYGDAGQARLFVNYSRDREERPRRSRRSTCTRS
jgi:Uma2 family endonuclease